MRWMVSVRSRSALHLGYRLATLLFSWLVGLMFLLGCSDAPQPTSVRGTVTYQGNRLDHGSVRFFGADGRPIGSVIQENGFYQIELLPGKYQVSVSSPPKLPPGYKEGDPPPPPEPNMVPAKYSQPKLSRLSTTVGSETPTQTYDIALK